MICPTCNKPEMVYGPHTPLECSLNQFQAMVDEQKLRFTPTNKDVGQLASLTHKFECKIQNGRMAGTFVSKAALEGIDMYRDMQIGDMTLLEFLETLGVER
jgi:hypothetical protein